MDLDRTFVDGMDLPDCYQRATDLTLGEIDRSPDAGYDVVRIELGSVVEEDMLTELKPPGQIVRAFPTHGKSRPDSQISIEIGQ